MTWEILGHEWATDLLRKQIARQRIRHAYLITGPPGAGRRTLALGLAQAINCPTPLEPGLPCGTCSTCLRLRKMQYPDLSVIQAEQEGGTLKVEQIRELQRGLSLAPYEGRYKIALLLRFEEAHPSAANALLKTLEEPSPRVVLILTAESLESLPPTIVSRCETIRLNPLPVETIKAGLENRWAVPPSQAELLAHLCSGRPGYAVRLHQQPELLERRAGWLDDQANLLHSGRVARFRYVELLAKDREQTRQALLLWQSYWRDVLLRAAGTAIPITNSDRAGEIHELALRVDMQTAHQAVKDIEKTLQRLDGNVNARLALEVLWMNLPYL
jgi:DNA polymerase III subunit delta'